MNHLKTKLSRIRVYLFSTGPDRL